MYFQIVENGTETIRPCPEPNLNCQTFEMSIERTTWFVPGLADCNGHSDQIEYCPLDQGTSCPGNRIGRVSVQIMHLEEKIMHHQMVKFYFRLEIQAIKSESAVDC